MTRIITRLETRAHYAFTLLSEKPRTVKQLELALKIKLYAVPSVITQVRKHGHTVWSETGGVYRLPSVSPAEEAHRFAKRNEALT